uniref:Uncharacterized protein n=1 Tax=Arundo donax TaxID=35708 RepID=A0A0A9GQ92_ARUDO
MIPFVHQRTNGWSPLFYAQLLLSSNLQTIRILTMKTLERDP